MTNYVVIDAGGLIVNRIVLEDTKAWPVPAGMTLAIETDQPMEIGGRYAQGSYAPPNRPPPPPTPPKTILSQDLISQLTLADAAKIQTAIASNVQHWLLWSTLQAQSQPIAVTAPRFMVAWNALVNILGQPRMNVIATALDAPSLVV